MRKLAAIVTLAFALLLGALSTASGALAAGPSATAAGPAVKVVAATHVWKATTKAGALHATSRIVLTATYSSGTVHVTAVGVKKGDVLHVWISARAAKGKAKVVVSMTKTASKTGTVSFTFSLSMAQAHLIRDDVKAGKTLTFHLKDGTTAIRAKYVKA